MNRKLQTARRALDRLEWEHDRALRAGADSTAYGLEPAIRDARWHVEDLEAAEANSTVRAARRTALLLDVVLGVVAVTVMAFSLRNIAEFAAGHGVVAPLPWLLAPMVDLALVGTLTADAFLSRNKITPGRWEAALRWFAGVGTLLLNDWDAVVTGAPGNVVAHTVPPLLLLLLAEAAPRYRRGAVAAVETVRSKVTTVHTAPPASAPVSAPEVVETGVADSGDDHEETAGHPASAPASETPSETAAGSAAEEADEDASVPPARTRPLPGAGRTVRPTRSDDELLAALRDLLTGAAGHCAACRTGRPRHRSPAAESAAGHALADPRPDPAAHPAHPAPGRRHPRRHRGRTRQEGHAVNNRRYQFDNPLPTQPDTGTTVPVVYRPQSLPAAYDATQERGQVVVQHIHQAPPDHTIQRVALGAGMGGGAIAAGVYFGPLLVASLASMAISLGAVALVLVAIAYGFVTVVRSIDGHHDAKTVRKALGRKGGR